MQDTNENWLENGSRLNIISTERNVSLMLREGDYSIGTIAADRTDWDAGVWLEGFWWLARLISKHGHRDKGFGTALLKKLQEELLKNPGFKILLVAPGGYDSDPKRLFEFYRRHGFKDREDGTLVWERP